MLWAALALVDAVTVLLLAVHQARVAARAARALPLAVAEDVVVHQALGAVEERDRLQAEDVADLQRLLIRRDRWIELYQNMELTKNRDLAESAAYTDLLAKRVRAPWTGYVVAKGDTEGLYGDDWASSKVRIQARALLPVTGILLRGFRPEEAGSMNLKVLVDGVPAVERAVSGYFELPVPVRKAADEKFELRFECDSKPGWGAASGNDRDLAFILMELRAQHPPTAMRK